MSRNRHHRRPRSQGGKTNRWNCCKVDSKRHYFWHCLFGNMPADAIMEDINTHWLDPRFKVVPR